jgi:hypothetical protein
MSPKYASKSKKGITARLWRFAYRQRCANDLETGAFEVDASEIAACDRLEASHPNAQIWIVRIGSRHVRRFSGRMKRAV